MKQALTFTPPILSSTESKLNVELSMRAWKLLKITSI